MKTPEPEPDGIPQPPPVAQSRGTILRRAGDLVWFALLAGVLLLLLHESLLLGKGLVPVDAILELPPWKQTLWPGNHLLADQYWTFLPTQEFVHQQKSLPLWNPYICCGAPNLGAIQGALLFPIRLLLSALDPFWASGPAAFIKLCLAGWFTMLYVRLMGVSGAASFLAGLVFSLSGFMIVWLGHPHVNCAMWLPLLLYLMEKAFGDGGGKAAAGPALRAWAGFAAAYACMILGGHPPTEIQITMVLVIYFLVRLAWQRDGQGLRRAGLLIGAVAAGLLLAAPQILPFVEYYRQSSSALPSGRWSSHLSSYSLIHFLLPNALGSPARGFEDLPRLLGWKEPDNFSERMDYVGIFPLFAAACGIALRPCKLTKFYSFLALGSMLLVFGIPPLPSLLRALPIVRDVNEERLLLFVALSVAVLAAFGWDEIFNLTRNRRRTLIVTLGFWALAGAAMLCFWSVIGPKIHTLDAPHLAFFRRECLILAVGMGAVLLAAIWPARWNGWVAMALCLGWTTADLLLFGSGYNPSIPRDLYYPQTPAIEWLQSDHSLYRIFGEGPDFTANTPEVYGVSDARGCDFMMVRRYQELVGGDASDLFFYRDPKKFPKNLPLLNVKYVLSSKPMRLSPLLADLTYAKEMLIYRFKPCLDRAFLVFNYQVETNQAAALARVSSPEFDAREVVLLEEQPPPMKMAAEGGAAGTATNGSVRVVSYEPDDITIEASAPRPAYLVLLDTYFPGWSATVNGEPAPILRADYNFRAVPLPAGRAAVHFSYRPLSFRIGLYLCGVGLLGLGAACFTPWRWKSGRAVPDAS